MCNTIVDVDNNVYTLAEAIKKVPVGCNCYKVIKDKDGKPQTELCPFLDWVQQNEFNTEEDFSNTGYCHLLNLGDWFSEKYGKKLDYVQLARFVKPLSVDAKRTGSCGLWQCEKNCAINLCKK